MGILDGLFGRKRRTIDDLTHDDLNRERISLQGEQRKLDQELERHDRDEAQLKSEYAVAATPSQKKNTARRIEELRRRRQATDTRASYCHKMLQTVNGFLLIKENMDFFTRMGVASLISTMDMGEIDKFINEATIEGTLRQEKLASMLQQVSEGATRITQASEDTSLDKLMAELDQEVAASPTAAKESDGALADLDAAIARGQEAVKQAQQRAARPPQREGQ